MLNAKLYQAFLLLFFLNPIIHPAAQTNIKDIIKCAFMMGYIHNVNTHINPPSRELSAQELVELNQELELFNQDQDQRLGYILEHETKTIIKLGALAANTIIDTLTPYTQIPKTIAYSLKEIAFFAFANGYSKDAQPNNITFASGFKRTLENTLMALLNHLRALKLLEPAFTALQHIFNTSLNTKANTAPHNTGHEISSPHEPTKGMPGLSAPLQNLAPQKNITLFITCTKTNNSITIKLRKRLQKRNLPYREFIIDNNKVVMIKSPSENSL